MYKNRSNTRGHLLNFRMRGTYNCHRNLEECEIFNNRVLSEWEGRKEVESWQG